MSDSVPYQIVCPKLPLAVYREVVAHLRQVNGVDADILPQTSTHFDYLESQAGGLWICYKPEADAASQQRVEQILAYYGNRHGAWEALKP